MSESGWTFKQDVPKVHILPSQPTRCINLEMLLTFSAYQNPHPYSELKKHNFQGFVKVK